MTPLLIKTRTASADIGARKIVAFSTVEGQVAQATSATDKITGVQDVVGATAGGPADIIQGGGRRHRRWRH